MSPMFRTWSARIACLSVAAAAAMLSTQEVVAQASGCGELQSILTERKTIAERLSAGAQKQVDAKAACAGFNQLVQNGNSLLKWSTANKDWCQIPDGFIESIRTDHNKASQIRGRACGVAAKQAEAEKNGGGAGTLLGGNGLSGATLIPQGAL